MLGGGGGDIFKSVYEFSNYVSKGHYYSFRKYIHTYLFGWSIDITINENI